MNTSMLHDGINILLVEDNPGDARLIIEALEDRKTVNGLHVVQDGEEALAFLHRDKEYADAPRPDVILLDLNLPKLDGHSVLAEIKSDPELRHLPVIVLTTSESAADVLNTYSLQGNCFVTKPGDFEQFTNALKFIEDFWLSHVKLPRS